MSAMRPTPAVGRFAAALDRFVRKLTHGEYQVLDTDGEDIPDAVVEQVSVLLSSLQLSWDALAQAEAAREVQRARALAHGDESGRVTATRVLHALDRYLSGLPPGETHERRRRSGRRERWD